MFQINLFKKLHSSQGEMLLDIDLAMEQGQFISIYGKSGAGKTTILKMIAGIMNPEKGSITVHNQVWFDAAKRINIVPQKRKIGFVFQNYALFPNMTVKQNLEFAVPDKKNKEIISELLDIMGLTGLSDTSVTVLSGGQQQRVALARALVKQPDLLLLDEPLSSLDNEMRWKLQDELINIHKHFKLTTIMISHDMGEIYRLSDRVIKIDFGKIIKNTTSHQLFHNNTIGELQLTAQVTALIVNDGVFIAKVISGTTVMDVQITKEQAAELTVGDSVLVISNPFNPILVRQ